MAAPRSVQRRFAATFLVCATVAFVRCGDLFVDPSDVRPIPIALSFAATAAGGSAQAFDAADRVAVRMLAGGAVVFEDVIAVTPGGGDIRLSVAAPADVTGATVTVEVEVLREDALLFVGSGTVTPGAGGDNTADIPLQPVPAAVLITPPSVTFDALGASAAFRASAVFATGDTIDGAAPTFRSLAPAIVQVDGAGAALSVAPGTTRVEAAFGGVAAQADAIVQQVVTTIEVNQPTTAVAAGATYVFEPILRDRNGYLVAGRTVAWSSSDPSILSIDANGVASAVSTGTATVTGTADVATVTFQVQVAAPAPTAPSGLSALVQGTTVILNWQDNSNNETRFEVRVRPAPGAPFGFVSATGANASTTSNNTNQPDARLEYVVRACNDAGCSADSNVVVAITVPSMPENLVIDYDTASSGYVARWTDTSTFEEYFHIEASSQTVVAFDVGKDETQALLGRSFPYGGAWVYACNAAGCSSPAVFVGCGGDCAPDAPLPVEPRN